MLNSVAQMPLVHNNNGIYYPSCVIVLTKWHKEYKKKSFKRRQVRVLRQFGLSNRISSLKSKFLVILAMAIFYAFVALCLVGSAFAQIITSGDCPKIKIQQNYDLSRFTGVWYEQERFFTLYETGNKCSVFEYIVNEEDETAKLIHNFTSITGEKQIIETPVIIPDPEEPARMLRKHPRSPVYNNAVVLGTDYDNWGIVYSCNDVCAMNLQYAWIVTREQVPDESVVARARAILEKNNIETSQLMKTEQMTCFK